MKINLELIPVICALISLRFVASSASKSNITDCEYEELNGYNDILTFICSESNSNEVYFDNNTHQIDCVQSDEMNIPKNYTGTIQFRDCQFFNIKFDIFSNYGSVHTLNFSGVELEFLSEDVLRGSYNKLRKLIVSDNQLRAINDKELFDSDELLQVDYSSNKISEIHAKAFAENQVIEILNLSKNQLRTLHPKVFGAQIYLQILDLSCNSIADLPTPVFDKLRNLRYLYLSHNKLSSIDFGMFFYQKELIFLDLSHNSLKQIDFKLNVAQHDQPMTLEKYLRWYLSNLKYLELRGNDFNSSYMTDIFDSINGNLQRNAFVMGSSCSSTVMDLSTQNLWMISSMILIVMIVILVSLVIILMAKRNCNHSHGVARTAVQNEYESVIYIEREPRSGNMYDKLQIIN